MKKIIKLLAVVLAVSVMLFTLVGCKTDDAKDAELQALQQQLKELSDKLQNLEQNGKPGANGQDGKTPYIGSNNNWWIGNIDTGIKAEGTPGKPGADGTDGQDGKTPYIGSNGNWWIGDIDTRVKAEGTNGTDGANGQDGVNGQDGKTPHIGTNGNWWIGDIDTGVKAEGTPGKPDADGANGQDGTNGQDGKTPFIGGNGNWWIGTTDTGVKAEGTNGTDGANGSNGQDGVNGQDGKTPFIGSNGNWWIGTTDTGVKAEGLTDKDQENLDNLIASNIYTKQKEFKFDEPLDIYCNGEIIVTLKILGQKISGQTSLSARLEVLYSKYTQPISHIADWIRLEAVIVDEATNQKQYTLAPKSETTDEDIIPAGGSNWTSLSFGGGG